MQNNYLTLVGDTFVRNKRTYGLWRCVCGTEKEIRVDSVMSGNTKSCGCMKGKNQPIINRIGEEYGALTVTRFVQTNPVIWECECKCGEIVQVNSLDLSRRKRLSCTVDCLFNPKRELRSSLIGKTFGKLYVKERAENYVSPKGQEQIRYLCECECGNKKIVHASALKHGRTKSCGCINSQMEEDMAKLLTQKNVVFEQQYSFPDCCNKRPLRFDFAIFKNEELYCLIELQGQQHFEPRGFKGYDKGIEQLEYTQKNDKIKVDYCKDKGIKLLSISYKHHKNFEAILKEEKIYVP